MNPTATRRDGTILLDLVKIMRVVGDARGGVRETLRFFYETVGRPRRHRFKFKLNVGGN